MGEAVVEEKAEDSDKVEAENEEIRQPRVARVPHTPTKVEWDTHMLLHADYRSWCPFCVQGKAHSAHHVMSQEEERLGVTISMDYTYMGTMEEEEKETGVAHLLMHDNATSAFWCMQVDSKEAKPEIVAWMNQNLVDAGYAGMRLTLKSDGEPAMVAVRNAVMKYNGWIMIPGNPAKKGEKAEKFWIEEAGRTIREYVCTFISQI